MTSNPEPSDSAEPDASQSLVPPALSPDELLPPVEPPSAGFIIQLFVVPAVIVAMVVLVGWLVTMMATSGVRDPKQIVAALSSSNPGRWQEAFELANALRTDTQEVGLKSSSELAKQLGELLQRECEVGNVDDTSVKLRTFLCSALGEFRVDDGVGALLVAAREDKDEFVRGSAINSLAVLSQTFQSLDPPRKLHHEDLVETLVDLANGESGVIRSHVAFALGVMTLSEDAEPQLTEELEKLVDDLHADARYNAALGLARRGSPLAVAPLVEMLDLQSLSESIQGETLPQLQTRKRNTILKNALDAVLLMKEKNPTADLKPLRTALEKFIEEAPDWKSEGEVPEPLIERAKDVREKLKLR